MTRAGLAWRSVRYYWRQSFAIGLGVALGAAVLSGALLVGDSMRGSLRESSLAGLGPITHVVQSPRMITAETAGRVSESLQGMQIEAAPLVLLPGSIVAADTDARANRVQIVGVNDALLSAWQNAGLSPDEVSAGIALNAALANELRARVGQDVLVRTARVSPISFDSMLGRRSDATVSARLTIRAIVPDTGIGALALRPSQSRIMNAFVSREWLARFVQQPERVNTLAFWPADAHDDPTALAAKAQNALDDTLRDTDLGVTVRTDAARNAVTIEATSLLLEPAIEKAAETTAKQLGRPSTRVITYLANRIRNERNGRETPYSTVTALDSGWDPAFTSLFVAQPTEAGNADAEGSAPIVISQWLADDLEARIGDTVTLVYDKVDTQGALASSDAAFVVSAIAPVNETTADPGFSPTFPGVTDSDQMRDWDPPFPVDLDRVRPKDEQWWDEHRAAPKAFIRLEDGRRIWGETDPRIGTLTSIRLRPADGETVGQLAQRIADELPKHVDAAAMGLTVTPARRLALRASQGSTDFSGLFIGFSLFLVVSAALLVTLLARLGIEQRSAEIGLLAATGFTPGVAGGLLLREHVLIALIGAAIGAPLGLAYATALLAGLQTWWAGAVAGASLRLHANALSVIIGFAGAAIIAILAAWRTSSAVCRKSPRALLARQIEDAATKKRGFVAIVVAIVSGMGAIAILAASAAGGIPAAGGFFGGGSLAMIACLSAWRVALIRHHAGAPARPGLAGQFRFGAGATPRQPGRSMLTASLIASATFLIVSLGAFHLDPADVTDRKGGAGGFTLFAEASTPMPVDPTADSARKSLSLSDESRAALSGGEAFAFRLRPGGSASCLNLYLPTEPRLLGASQAFIDRGGFQFAGSMFKGETWKALHHTFDDGAIPVIGDEAAVQWQLHKALGDDLVIHDDSGREQRLRFVALLSGSLLQDELIIADDAFRRLFPRIDGYGFLLIATPVAETQAVSAALEKDLSEFGLDVGDSAARMRDFFAVQNTYLSTFQTLGGLGLALGVVGLAIVMLRHVIERRGELALLRAIGFPDDAVTITLLAEHGLVMLVGLVCGLGPALLAIAPVARSRPTDIPWLALAWTLGIVLLSGGVSLLIAARRATRAPILPALRSE
ncbi:MAG: ABC transporter permease [Phycisphaerales bacterium]|nr:ABC transporter permease [Phycisphaerales bacterium]